MNFCSVTTTHVTESGHPNKSRTKEKKILPSKSNTAPVSVRRSYWRHPQDNLWKEKQGKSTRKPEMSLKELRGALKRMTS